MNTIYNKISTIMISFLLVFSTNHIFASEGESCEELEALEVTNEMQTTSANMNGKDYYFQFTPTDSTAYFSISSVGDMPSLLELYYESCESELIESATLFLDSNNIDYLELKSYNLIPSGTYFLKVVQNSANSAHSINLNYVSFSSSYPAEFGCNEVVNGSFESYLNLGNSSFRGKLDRRVDYSLGWSGPLYNNFSADYYHVNAGHPDSRIPLNKLGNQAAKIGPSGANAYAGLFAMLTSSNVSSSGTTNPSGPYQYREWMYGTLNSVLNPNETYRITYYVALSTDSKYNSDCVAPGLRFVNGINNALTPADINNMTPHIQNLTVQQAGGGWVEVSGDYLATGNESHFIIANFLPDNQSVAPANVGNYGSSYFFIDEVSVESVDACCNGDITIENANVDVIKDIVTSANYTTVSIPSVFPNQPNETYIEISDMDLNFKGVITIDKNIIFKNCRILMGVDAKVNVTKGLVLSGNEERYIKSCNPNKFWDGIYVDGGAGGNFRIYNLPGGTQAFLSFENSMNGIVTENQTYLYVRNVKFDRNNLAIQISPNTSMSVGNMQFVNSTFECSSPVFDFTGNEYYPQKSVIVDNYTLTSSINNPRVTFNLCEFNGEAGLVEIKNSYTEISNSTFQNFNNVYSGPNITKSEIALKIEGTTNNGIVTNYAYLKLNTYNSNETSIIIDRSAKVRIDKGTDQSWVNYDHNLGQAIIGVPNSTFLKASNNFYSTTASNFDGMLEIENVQIYNVETAFQLSNILSAEITNCYIDLETQPSTSFYTSKNNIYGTGISLNNYGIQQLYLDPTNTYTGNIIKHAKIGISVNFAQVELVNNTIEDLNDLTAAPGSCLPYLPPCPARPAWGIRVNNSEATIIENKVINNINQYTLQPNHNLNVTGIELINSMLYNQGNTVSSLEGIYCNNVDNTGIGIKFSASNSMFTKIHNNKMADNYYGLVLANNGSLDNVGFSGSGGAGHNNFIPSVGGRATYSSFSNAALCTLYTEGGGGAFDPVINITDATPSYTAFTKDNTGNTVQSPGCNTRARIANPNTLTNANLSKSAGTNRSGFTPSLRKSPAMVHASDSALIYQNQMAFYRMLKDSAMMGSKQWKPFVDSMKLTPMGRALGLSGRNAVSTNSSNFDANLIQMNPIVERFEQGLKLNATDMDQIRLMAIKCPYYDGIAVYQARYVLEALGESTIASPCELVEAPAKQIANNGTKNGEELDPIQLDQQFRIYPNPTKDIVNINYIVTKNESVILEIIDVMGKIQLTRDLNTTAFHSIQLSEVKNGIYFYRLVKNDATVHSGKLIIE